MAFGRKYMSISYFEFGIDETIN